MSQRIKQIILIGIAVVVLMGMFPPWSTILRNKHGDFISESSEGYGFLLDPPEPYQKTRLESLAIDWKRLSLQVALVLLATGGAVFVFGEKQPGEKPPVAAPTATGTTGGGDVQPPKSTTPKPKTHPWRRFFARQIDMTILYAFVGVAAAIAIPAMNISGESRANVKAAHDEVRQTQENIFDQFDEKNGTGFDVKGALAEGYSEAEIADYLGNRFDATVKAMRESVDFSFVSDERFKALDEPTKRAVFNDIVGQQAERDERFAKLDDASKSKVLDALYKTHAAPKNPHAFFKSEGEGLVFFYFVAFLFPLAILPFVEGFLVSSFNTPGKALLGIKVRRVDGSRLTYEEGFNRALRVVLYGLGLGLPIISLVTGLFSYRRLTKEGVTTWDKIGGLTVIRNKTPAAEAATDSPSNRRVFFAVIVCIVFIATINIVGMAVLGWKHGGGGVTQGLLFGATILLYRKITKPRTVLPPETSG